MAGRPIARVPGGAAYSLVLGGVGPAGITNQSRGGLETAAPEGGPEPSLATLQGDSEQLCLDPKNDPEVQFESIFRVAPTLT